MNIRNKKLYYLGVIKFFSVYINGDEMIIEYTKTKNEEICAVEKRENKYICNRCFNDREFYQDELGVYCLKCLMFKKSSTYKIIKRVKVDLEFSKVSLRNIIYLSHMQQKASNACIKAYQDNYDLLLYAVCGAGKTEIVYDVILKALNDKKVVCFTTPRKDVVCEITPRFKRDFLNVDIVSLYSGSNDMDKKGNLYISTIHQLINYYQYFDLIILDEVDAFPYHNNKMLEKFIYKAKKQSAPIIYLTATPTSSLKMLMKQNKLKSFLIPARFHQHPIPIPKLVLTTNTVGKVNKGKLPRKIKVWLEAKKRINKQVFIFVPNIELGIKLEKILLKDFNCKFVYSYKKQRKAIIDAFRQRKIQFIITTTILERGVTVSNVDVCIINCDNSIFDERAIEQIVGRSGRDKNYPRADVILFSEYNTKAIKLAIKSIKRMNKIAYQNNLIRSIK